MTMLQDDLSLKRYIIWQKGDYLVGVTYFNHVRPFLKAQCFLQLVREMRSQRDLKHHEDAMNCDGGCRHMWSMCSLSKLRADLKLTASKKTGPSVL